MASHEIAALLRLLASKGPPSVSGKAARALASPTTAQQVLNDLVAEVLGMEGDSRFTDEDRAALVAAIVPSTDPSADYDKGPFEATLPRVRCRQDQLERFTASMADAGFNDVAKYIRWRLFG